MSKTELRKFLARRSAQQLTQEILILHERFPAVREYFASRLKTELGAELFGKYTRKIDAEFSISARNPTGRPSKGRQFLREYRRAAVANEDVIEISLYYVAAVLTFMRSFGIQENTYFRTVESSFHEAAQLAAAHDLATSMAGAFEEVIGQAMETSEHLGGALRDVAGRYGLTSV
jgi:hypothetical protein